MSKFLIAVSLLIALAGCGTLQISEETEPFPSEYRETASNLAAMRIVAPGAVAEVSHPRPLVGVGAFSPQRWYYCVREFVPPPTVTVPPIAGPVNTLNTIFGSAPDNAHFQILVVEHGPYHVTKIVGLDAELCSDGEFEPLDPSG